MPPARSGADWPHSTLFSSSANLPAECEESTAGRHGHFSAVGAASEWGEFGKVSVLCSNERVASRQAASDNPGMMKRRIDDDELLGLRGEAGPRPRDRLVSRGQPAQFGEVLAGRPLRATRGNAMLSVSDVSGPYSQG